MLYSLVLESLSLILLGQLKTEFLKEHFYAHKNSIIKEKNTRQHLSLDIKIEKMISFMEETSFLSKMKQNIIVIFFFASLKKLPLFFISFSITHF